MILGLHHAAIAVPDIDAGVRFYAGVLGFDIVDEVALPGGIAPLAEAFGIEDSACAVRMLRKGNSFIELFEYETTHEGDLARPVNRSCITHIALSSDDPEADYARLEGEGVVFNAPLFGASPTRFAYGRDPFGNVIELLEHGEGETARRFD